MKLLALPVLIAIALAFEEKGMISSSQNEVLVKIEEDEHMKIKHINYIGVTYSKSRARWRVYRVSKKKRILNGSYKDEETAAHASDTLARKLIANGENGHKLNFPNDNIAVGPEFEKRYDIGLWYNKIRAKWQVQRWSTNENKKIYNGYYKDKETAAHASDTLARKLIANGEQNHKINFPEDDTEVYPTEKTSNYIGVTYNKRDSRWGAYRHSKKTNATVANGNYKNEKAAAHASDILAKNLIAKGEKGHKLNFGDAENLSNKRKRPAAFDVLNK